MQSCTLCSALLLIFIKVFELCLCRQGLLFFFTNPSPAFVLSFTGVTGANADLDLIGIEVPSHLYPFFN